jgi:hypothetical protein
MICESAAAGIGVEMSAEAGILVRPPGTDRLSLGRELVARSAAQRVRIACGKFGLDYE